ncbi:hypothetical protein OU798_23595 [Prolixibacteraceae bacterium Z1-6]|uniref:Uncharacterized protein n=1 Tax=Draconibacterium aestuarii TaxID=2998507 RepID=A0A9X3FAE2_9BACT|nr:hypothetical protein [Prolixibacteraceae bacterium Z1-6]
MSTINPTTNSEEIKSTRPNQPVASFLQEAENLWIWCEDDIPELIKAGIDEAFLNELPQRIEACRKAQTIWETKLQTPGEAQVQWKLQVYEAQKLLTELLHSMRFAFRSNADLSDSLKYFAKESGYASLIQGLYTLSVLGRSNSQLLTAIGFDLDLLDTASAKSEELAALWAQSKNEKEYLTETTVLRNKAFWYLHQQVAEIRSAGQYIFRHRKDRYIGYISQFWKHKNKRRSTPDK